MPTYILVRCLRLSNLWDISSDRVLLVEYIYLFPHNLSNGC